MTAASVCCYTGGEESLAKHGKLTIIMVKLMRLGHGVRRFVIAAILIVLTTVPAPAQNVQRIAAVVNDDAVSLFDVFERVKLIVATSGLQASPELMQRLAPQVLRTLIDEHLKLQEGKRRNIAISEDEIDQAFSAIEQGNQMPAGSFLEFLKKRRIDIETVTLQLRAERVWSKLINRRLLRSASVSDEDIDDELERLRENLGQPEYLLSEIYLSVDTPSEDQRVRDDAAELVRQLRDGADFDTLVNQFSQGVTANKGGGVGWVSTAQLSPAIVSAINTMETGKISDPIAAVGGYYIIQLRDRRQLQPSGPDDTEVDLKQILLTLPADSTGEDIDATMALATLIRENISGCDDMLRIAAETDASVPGDLGIVRFKDTPDAVRAVLRDLPLTTVSEPVRTEAGIHLLMICGKTLSDSNLPSRFAIRDTLLLKRLNQVSRQYLRDLRRDAFIDVRI